MRIEVKGRNVVVGDDLRERIEKRCEKMARQVSPLAELDVELSEERNPSIRDGHIAECTLRLKGVTLRSRTAAANMTAAVNEAADDPPPPSQAPPRQTPRPPPRPHGRGRRPGNRHALAALAPTPLKHHPVRAGYGNVGNRDGHRRGSD